MKRIIPMLLALLLLVGCAAEAPVETTTEPPVSTVETTKPDIPWQTQPADRQLLAKQYFVYDCEAGKFLVKAEDASAKIYPASVTKLFTAYVALQYLNADKTIQAGEVLGKVAAGSSVAELVKGDKLTVRQLVAGMLLPSGNDAAYILAEAAGRAMYGSQGKDVSVDKAINKFVETMNKQAELLGMAGTHFANPDGIHSDEHYTTYQDLVILGMAVLNDPVILEYAAISGMEVTLGDRTVNWKNTNELVDPSSPYYCAYAVGLKTGQTPKAGSCLLSAFEYKGRTLIVGVFGCPQPEDRFPDTLQLFTEAVK